MTLPTQTTNNLPPLDLPFVVPMKAYLVEKYKSPMRAGEAAEPTVGDRDVLVEIHAAGVNMLDAKIRDGEFKLLVPYKAPFVLGHDLAGVVNHVGPAVTRFSVGDEVYGRPRDGRIRTFAERIAVHEDDLATKPFDEGPQALAHVEGGRTKGRSSSRWSEDRPRSSPRLGQHRVNTRSGNSRK